MGRRPSLARLFREVLVGLQSRSELEKIVKASPRVREKFELQMWALYGMLQWEEQKSGPHPGWTARLSRLANELEEHELTGQAFVDSVLSCLRDFGHHDTTDE